MCIDASLHGMVATEAEKNRADRVARDVKEVKNLLQIVPTYKREAVEAADATIKDGVEAAFKANRRVSNSGVKVASVNKGVVLLSGKTKSLQAHLCVAQVARRGGVVRWCSRRRTATVDR